MRSAGSAAYASAMSTPSQPGSWPPPNDPSNPYAAAPGGTGYGAPSAPGGGYPGGAYPGGPYGAAGAPASKPSRPGAVTGSFLLWVLGAVAAVVSIVILVNSPDWDRIVADAVRNNPDGFNGVTPQQLVNTVKGILIGVFVVFALLYVFFAFMMWNGRNWARIVLTVLGALGIIGSFTPSTTSGSITIDNTTYTTTTSSYNWITGVLTLIAIVLMYLPAANAYFRDSKAFRQAAKYR